MKRMMIALALISVVLISGCVDKGVSARGSFSFENGSISVQPEKVDIDLGAIFGSMVDGIKDILNITSDKKTPESNATD